MFLLFFITHFVGNSKYMSVFVCFILGILQVTGRFLLTLKWSNDYANTSSTAYMSLSLGLLASKNVSMILFAVNR